MRVNAWSVILGLWVAVFLSGPISAKTHGINLKALFAVSDPQSQASAKVMVPLVVDKTFSYAKRSTSEELVRVAELLDKSTWERLEKHRANRKERRARRRANREKRRAEWAKKRGRKVKKTETAAVSEPKKKKVAVKKRVVTKKRKVRRKSSKTRIASVRKKVPKKVETPEIYRRTEVEYVSTETPGTIIIETSTRHLYRVVDDKTAIRYGVAVGREGFAWSGEATIERKVEWPTWTPPKEMIARSPKLKKWAKGQPGGPTNPLGAAALYLFQGSKDTLYRIHGTNAPSSIGHAASSGCIRMFNKDIQELYTQVAHGTKVIVR